MREQKVQLIKCVHDESVLAEADFKWSLGETLDMTLRVVGGELVGEVNGATVLTAQDSDLDTGAVGLVVADGRSATHKVRVANAG